MEQETLLRRLELAELRVACAREMMTSLAGFCHALAQPAMVFVSSVELLEMGCDDETRKELVAMCNEATQNFRTLLAQMKEKRAYVKGMLFESTESPADVESLKALRATAQPHFTWEQ